MAVFPFKGVTTVPDVEDLLLTEQEAAIRIKRINAANLFIVSCSIDYPYNYSELLFIAIIHLHFTSGVFLP